MNFEIVVRGKKGDGIVDLLVMEDRVGYRIQCTSCSARLGN